MADSTTDNTGSTPNEMKLVDLEETESNLKKSLETAYEWTYQNGRRYASTELGHYYMPNDEPEIQRLNEQHWILTQVKGGLLHHAPIPNRAGLKILDIGCGSGIWCIQMAEDYPSAMIIGMDVSPIQPKTKPANVEWYTHDMEKELPFPEHYFDFIHLSLVHGCVSHWDQLMKKIVHHLASHGWVEHQEFSLCRQYLIDDSGERIPMSEDPKELPPFFRWNRLMEQAALKRGRDLQLGPRLADFQRTAGLENINEKIFMHKWGTWMSNPAERTLGARTMLSAISGMEGFTTMMFTKVLGWSVEETQAFIVEVKRDMRDDSLRKVMNLHVVYSQKPATIHASNLVDHKASKSGSRILGFGAGILIGATVATTILAWSLRRRVS